MERTPAIKRALAKAAAFKAWRQSPEMQWRPYCVGHEDEMFPNETPRERYERRTGRKLMQTDEEMSLPDWQRAGRPENVSVVVYRDDMNRWDSPCASDALHAGRLRGLRYVI